MSNNFRLYTLHILWITAFLSIPIFTSPDLGQNMFHVNGFLRNFCSYILVMVFFYTNYYVFIPKFYFPKKYVWFGLFVVGSYLVVATVPDALFPMFGGKPMRPPHMDSMPHGPMTPPSDAFFWANGGGSVFQFLLVLLLSIMLRIRNRLREMNDEKMKAEISYLRAQINPHFLFNTLNSLYALTIAKSDDAPNAVLRLSSMMRYVTTESSSDFVPLKKEIEYLHNYIELQQLRIADHTRLSFTVFGDATGKQIAPMMVLPLVENAFKYGINAEADWRIDIEVNITATHFTVKVTNRKVHVSLSEAETSGHGLGNTQQRLEILYPGKHGLKIEEDEQQYSVTLDLELA